MTLLFIGGTGNISSDCAALLHERGHEIFVVTRGQSEVPSGYRKIIADRRNPSQMREALKAKPDVVINFLGFEPADVQIDYEVFKGSISQYLFISSATVYAKPPPRLPMTEESPLGNPLWDYAMKKLACERWLLERWEEDKFPVTLVRPSHTYSKRWVPNPLSSASFTFAARLEQGKPVCVPDDGENPWTLTAASDFAIGFAGLVGKKDALGEAFHITSDEVLTWNQICRQIATALGVENPKIVKVPSDSICQVAPHLKGNIKGDKTQPGVFDNSKIKRMVPEFQCRKSFQEGVRESVAWLRQHPEQQNLNPELDAIIERLCDSADF